jgi:hypothetical protein
MNSQFFVISHQDVIFDTILHSTWLISLQVCGLDTDARCLKYYFVFHNQNKLFIYWLDIKVGKCKQIFVELQSG